MKKYIVREVEQPDFSFYFDDDCNNLFVVQYDGYGRINGFNTEEYKKICRSACELAEMFDDISRDGYYASWYASYKECMIDNGIEYNSRKCHVLKELLRDFDEEPENIAEYLTITTGREWGVVSARGYLQSDYCKVIFCKDFHSNPKAYGEVWLGAAKEFCTIELDENGEEIDSCYGYIVADCEAWRDEDYKRLVCEWAGLPEDETQIEMIDGYTTYTNANYRIA